ncbi:MAG: 50S ribosomal protein L11 methyltransferase [Desulfomonilaceae bacterium]
MSQFIPKEWLLIEVLISAELVDAASCFMHEMGSQGIMIEDEVSPAKVTGYFDPGLSAATRKDLFNYVNRLSENFPEMSKPVINFRTIMSENWAVAWKDNFKIIEIGSKITISPPWLNPGQTNRHIIIIQPAEAFGTGSHETTQGCLELLEEIISERVSNQIRTSVLDVGCGSGILSIATKKLGAEAVTGIDNDPVAIESAKENSALNNIDDIEFKCMSIEGNLGKFDLVVANLDAMTISSNVSNLKNIFVDRLIISGITLDQWDSLRKELEDHSLNLLKEVKKTQWVSGVFDH